jgi:membrane protease YdiL (CAAX protease family)
MSVSGFEQDAAVQLEAPPLPPFSSSSVVRRAIADFASALGVTLLLVVPIMLVWLAFTQGDKATLSARKLPFGLLAFITLLQESQFAVFGWRRFRKNRSEGRPSASQSNAGYALRTRPVLLGVAAGAGLTALGELVGWVTHAKPSVEIMDLLSGLRSSPWAAACVFALVAAVAPVCEEILFRGAIFGLAHANGQTWTGAIITSVLFAIGHSSLRMAPYYLVFSAVNCWLLAKTRTLAGPIAAHVTVNLSACIGVFFGAHI